MLGGDGARPHPPVILPGMPPARRLSRDQFHAALAGMDRAGLAKILWTLYWRGPAQGRERIEDLIEPQRKEARQQGAPQPPAAAEVLARVTEFAALARSGAYLAGDRRVSPKERTRWRHTFRGLAQDSRDALGDDVETAVRALSILIDLACETSGVDYFRSEDPVEAARFVVSDEAAAMWSRLRDARGANHMVEQAVGHLLRWERRYGWTRRGEGWVSEREASLASTLADFLVVPDLWVTAAHRYADLLAERTTSASGRRRGRTAPAAALREWDALLLSHLDPAEHANLLERLPRERR